MHPDLLEAARRAAVCEMASEDFLSEVERIKRQLREHVPFWHKVFPWKINISIKRRRQQ